MLGYVAELRADPVASGGSRVGGNPYASVWSVGTKSSARLIAAPAAASGPYRAGVEIQLAAGAHTYWRSPGEAGVPPVFDFTGSENVKNAVVSYPAPARIDEAGFELFGYRGDVVFPVDIELADDSRPAVLALTLDYAVCGDICLPVKARAKLALPARPGAGAAPIEPAPEAASINEARAKTPLRLDDAARDAKIAIVRAADIVRPSWLVRVKPEPQAAGSADPRARGDRYFRGVPGGLVLRNEKDRSSGRIPDRRSGGAQAAKRRDGGECRDGCGGGNSGDDHAGAAATKLRVYARPRQDRGAAIARSRRRARLGERARWSETMTIKTGDRIPKVSFSVMTPEGPAVRASDEIFKGRRVVLIGVPGAFTPTCSSTHLPGFAERADAFKEKNIDEIAVTSVNDVFVMTAWAKDTGTADSISFLADGSGDFARALGLTLDLSERGLGVRSQRYSMLVEDGVVTKLNVETAPSKAEVSSAEALLNQIH